MVRDNSPLRIVMVDDDNDDLFLTKMAFKKADFPSEFIGLNTGKSLFDHIRNNGIGSIDILLLDLNMPLQDGHDILAQLSGYPHFDDLHVIMFSTSRRTVDKTVSTHLGATDFIVKPSTVSETNAFLEIISKLMNTREYSIAS